MSPDFEELIGNEPEGAERDRLRQTHELLMLAGPPPELVPGLEAGPAMEHAQVRRRRQVKRRTLLLIAAAISIAAVFSVGYAVGNGGGTSPVATLKLQGTALVPRAYGTMEILPLNSGNWPMTLTAADLPKLARHSYYEVYLVRDHKPILSCGLFTTPGGDTPVTVNLSVPYRFRSGNTWVVTKQAPGRQTPGPVVLRPTTPA